MSEWMPISTAPKDGTEFQAWVITDDGDGFWEPRAMYNSDGTLGLYGRIDYDIDGWDFGLIHLKAVYWTPQPKPPEQV